MVDIVGAYKKPVAKLRDFNKQSFDISHKAFSEDSLMAMSYIYVMYYMYGFLKS